MPYNESMRPKGTSEDLQRRRERAIALFEQGARKAEIARSLGTSRASVSRWCRAYQHDGTEGIQARATPGRPAKLSAKQKRRLLRRIRKGAKANGFPAAGWTRRRIAALIQQLFGVRYHVDSMPRFLAALEDLADPERPNTP